jgi:hypothetical protein
MLAFAPNMAASEPCRRAEMASSWDLPKIEPARHLACFIAVIARLLPCIAYWSSIKLKSLEVVPTLWFLSVAAQPNLSQTHARLVPCP